MRVEIHSIEELEAYVEEHGSVAGAVVQGLDLAKHSKLIAGSAAGAVFLGCELPDTLAAALVASGGLLFPRLPNLPYRPYRPALYGVEELMQGYLLGDSRSIAETLDSRIYDHYTSSRRAGPAPIMEALAQRLHDHAIDNALDELIHGEEPARLVAIMGGHAMRRDESAYAEVARVGRGLARRGFMVVSGGGPGAMEASHLGAWLAKQGDSALDDALAVLAAAPTYRDRGWHDTAFEVRSRYSDPAASLGIPTWFYGHEPPNLFATHIAKYFSNSLREDGLLAIARHGVVYSPGSAGTIQEIFMDAAQNHYGTFRDISPMVFMGRSYWTEEKPVYPLLEVLASGKKYGEMLSICDGADEVLEAIQNHPPVPYQAG